MFVIFVFVIFVVYANHEDISVSYNENSKSTVCFHIHTRKYRVVASAIPCPAISSEGRFVLLYSPTCWSVRKKGSCCFRRKVKFLPTESRYICTCAWITFPHSQAPPSFPSHIQYVSVASSTLKWERRKAERGLGTRLGLPQSGLLGYTVLSKLTMNTQTDQLADIERASCQQARSQDFEGGLRRCLMCMYAYINKQADKTRGVWGDAPPGN